MSNGARGGRPERLQVVHRVGHGAVDPHVEDAAVRIPFIEVHLSNVFAREKFRHLSYFTNLAVGIISGMGGTGYELALEYALQQAPGG